MIKTSKTLLYILVFLLALLPDELALRSDKLPDISALRLILFLLSIFFLVGYLYDRRFNDSVDYFVKNNRLLFFIFFAFFGWRILVSLLSPYGSGSVGTAIRDIFYFAVPFFLCMSCLHYQRAVVSLAQLVGVSAVICLTIGLIEYITGFRLYAAMTPADSSWNIIDDVKGRYVGILATFPHPLAMGAFMALVMSFGFLLYSHQNGNRRYQAMLVMSVGLVGILISTSRGALGAIVTGVVFNCFILFSALYGRVNGRQKLLAAGLFGPAAIFIIGAILFAVAFALVVGAGAEQYSSAAARVLQLQMAVDPILNRPLYGYGVGSAAEALGMKSLSVDNYYLTVALESGGVGLLLFLVIQGVFLYRATRLYFRHKYSSYRLLAVLLVVQYTQLLVVSLKQGLPFLYVSFALVLLAEKDALTRFYPRGSGK